MDSREERKRGEERKGERKEERDNGVLIFFPYLPHRYLNWQDVAEARANAVSSFRFVSFVSYRFASFLFGCL